MSDTILLLGHGSADREGAEEFVHVLDAVRAVAPDRRIEAGFLEFYGPVLPSIAEAIDTCARRGDQRILAIPILLAYAGHAKYDMPAQLQAGRERHPGLPIQAAPPFGIQEPLLRIVEERIRQAQEELPPTDAAEVAVLLVGRGTSDPEANADIYKIGRLLVERNPYGLVECCFIAMTDPRVPAGIERCVRLGARRIIVVPYFINTGTLVKRIWSQAEAAGRDHAGVEVLLGKHMGADPALVRLILERAEALAQGGEETILQSERMCLYRCGAVRTHHHHDHAHHHHEHPAAALER